MPINFGTTLLLMREQNCFGLQTYQKRKISEMVSVKYAQLSAELRYEIETSDIGEKI